MTTNTGIQHRDTLNAADSGTHRIICNDYRTIIKCSEGHAQCASCIEQNLMQHLSDGCQLLCLISGCPRKLQDKDLVKYIPIEMYNQMIEKRVEKNARQECFLRFESQFACERGRFVSPNGVPLWPTMCVDSWIPSCGRFGVSTPWCQTRRGTARITILIHVTPNDMTRLSYVAISDPEHYVTITTRHCRVAPAQ